MTWKTIRKRVNFFRQYLPLTLNGLLVLVGIYWIYRQVGIEQADASLSDSFRPFVTLLSKSALLLILAVVCFALLSLVLSFSHFLWLRRKGKGAIKLVFDASGDVGEGQYRVLVEGLQRPWLGTVGCRLLYDDGLLSPKVSLWYNQRTNGKLFKTGIYGEATLDLPDVKEYDLEGCFILFEDVLHLFSFPYFQAQVGHFSQNPKMMLTAEERLRLSHADRDLIRVEEAQRVSGDYVNYKDFEGGDDIRRIVWQVYAKNRELVVRIPEERDFYASSVNLYVSFYNNFSSKILYQSYVSEMLNYYKNCVWSGLAAFLSRDIHLRFLPDQILRAGESLSKTDLLKLNISQAQWQQSRNLLDYLPGTQGGVLFVSSFNDPDDVSEALQGFSGALQIYFVPLSETFRQQSMVPSWLSRIFFLPPDDRLKRLRAKWPLTPLKRQIIQREAKLMAVFESLEVSWIRLGRR